ncbi:odorant receptor 13a-like [Frieseomelitta varia]|uniref:odorant receptor 13a-like n=1 Tax=Frieseomelitta varia TaxID=561572 RepID=UPI001CB6905A|nr:odorant receptor 13a-like [Frieseomelitta varia]
MHPPIRNHVDHPRNPNYEKDIVYVTRHNKWVLNSIGIWPAVLKGIGQFLPKIAIGVSNLVLFFTLVQCVLHIVFEQKDPLLRLKILGLTCFSFISLMKYWALTARKSKIEHCIEQLYADWKQVKFQRDRKLMLKYGKIGRKLTVYGAVFMYSGGIIYHTIMQYAIGSYVDEFNRTIKLLVYPTYSALYDVQKDPIYELVYVLQCMCGYVFDSVTAGACGLAALFATHACGQIDIVMSRIEDLIDGKFSEEATSLNVRLVEIVQRHIKTLKFSAMIETVLQEVCFLEFFGSTFVICLLEFYCITDWEQNNKIGLMTYSLLLTSLTFNMFLLCYIGDLLIEKSTNVGISCCMIDWYRLPAKTVQDLILIIAMSNNPSKISAGRIVDLSLASFGSVGFY